MELSQYAKENGLKYITAWRMFNRGEIQGERVGNRIMVQGNEPKEEPKKLDNVSLIGAPLVVGGQEISASRNRRAASTQIRTDEFKNIEDGVIPFSRHGNLISAKDMVLLTQKAYYNFSIFRNTIDLMTEFSSGKLYLTGGTEKSRKLFKDWLEVIRIGKLQDKFFREYYRSGNVIVNRLSSKINSQNVGNIRRLLNLKTSLAKEISIPTRYVILNPVDIKAGDTTSFEDTIFYKAINAYELAVLKNPVTEHDKRIVNSLPEDIQRRIKNGESVDLPLDMNNIRAIFYKKQDYEPFGVPMGFPVLKDLNWKQELKQIDMAIGRTMQQSVLLVTTGAEPDKGGFNPENIALLKEIFKNESVGRTLIHDYTTKAQFVIPQIGDILDPKKYEIVDRDIQLGLNNILIGGEKFANQSIKVKIFIERLRHARQEFLDEFLIPEMEILANQLGLQKFPEPKFVDIDLDDNTQMLRVYVRMAELGILTAEEVMNAIEDGRLPTKTESMESQLEYKQARKKELYSPLIGGGKNDEGRPPGSKAPQSSKKVKPIGTKAEVEGKFLHSKVMDNLKKFDALKYAVIAGYKQENNLKRINKKHEPAILNVLNLLLLNEKPEKWEAKAIEYIKKPFDQNTEQVKEIQELATELQTSETLAGILYHSKKD